MGYFKPMTASNTLQDRLGRPLRDLRISLVDNCNFRCPYCMPRDLFPEDFPFLQGRDLLSLEELRVLVDGFRQLGLEKVKLTGGEPLLRPTFVLDLVQALRHDHPELELDLITNGWHLKPLVGRLKAAGLDRINISLDSLDEVTFGQLNGKGHALAPVLEAIEASSAGGFNPVKVNMVVIRGVNDREILDMAEYFRRPGFILRFIEFMDVGTMNGWSKEKVVPSREILELLCTRYTLEPLTKSHPGETADRWAYTGGTTEVGFISSVSQPFCGDCSRARLSADGKLYTCLFSKTGWDLRKLLREGARAQDVADTVRDIWQGRIDQYSALRSGKPGGKTNVKPEDRIEMFYIGG